MFMGLINENPKLIILSFCLFLIGFFCADVYSGKEKHEKVLIVDKIYVPEKRSTSYHVTTSSDGKPSGHYVTNHERQHFLFMVKNNQNKIKKLDVKAEVYYSKNINDEIWVKIGIGGISRFTYYVEPDLNFNKTDW